MIRPFLIALQFLTRLPVRIASEPDETNVAYSLIYYPLIGLIIGLLLSALAWIFRDMPALFSAGLLLTSWVLVTGGLHLDGLADSIDAWAGGMGDREKTMAIMKDPCCGPAGVVSIVLVLLLKFAALYALLETGSFLVLLLTPVLGRAVLILLFVTTPYVRPNGLGAIIATHLPRQRAILVMAIIVVAMLFLAGSNSLWQMLAVMFVFLWVRTMTMRRIGGMTGDVAGALVEITEVAVLASGV